MPQITMDIPQEVLDALDRAHLSVSDLPEMGLELLKEDAFVPTRAVTVQLSRNTLLFLARYNFTVHDAFNRGMADILAEEEFAEAQPREEAPTLWVQDHPEAGQCLK